MTRVTIPHIYIQCRQIDIIRDDDIGAVEIHIDGDALRITVLGDAGQMPIVNSGREHGEVANE